MTPRPLPASAQTAQVPTRWLRVSRSHPCPVCDKPDWCLVTADRSAAICPRTPEGSVKLIPDAGYLHRLTDQPYTGNVPHTIRLDVRTEPAPDLTELARQYQARVDNNGLQRLGDDLDVSAESLRRLGIGWAGWGWTFPMKDARGRVRGIRVRKRDGSKLAVGGSRDGLFIPDGLGALGASLGTPLLICEGPTDTAALLDLGFDVVGRPSCQGGTRLLTELAKVRQVREAVIVADNDEHGAGQDGADKLAAVLVAYVPSVRVISPPTEINDARAWKRCGGAHDDIRSAIGAADVRRLSVRVRKGNLDHG